jgi:hypothetical protein
MTISELAREAAGYFETTSLDGGRTFIKRRDDTTKWIKDLVQNARDQFPDDWRYYAIYAVLDEIARRELETTGDMRDVTLDIADQLTDVNTGNLIGWMYSSFSRTDYVDKAIQEIGYPGSIVQAIQLGQRTEYREIIKTVIQSLGARLEDIGGEHGQVKAV